MTRQNDDIIEMLEEWPDLVPDAQVMEQTIQHMVNRLVALREEQVEDLSVPQFRLLTAVWAIIAIMVYLSWPYITDFFAEYPTCKIILICIAGISLFAPLLLLPLLRGERADTIPSQVYGGTTP
jgi:hypothetical protein